VFVGQNLVIPGSCFLLAMAKPNVTSVFGRRAKQSRPRHSIKPLCHSQHEFDRCVFWNSARQARVRLFLIYAAGQTEPAAPETALPAQAPQGCPLGNSRRESDVSRARVDREVLIREGHRRQFRPAFLQTGAQLRRAFSILTLVGKFSRWRFRIDRGVAPRKIKLKDFDPTTNRFSRMTLKGGCAAACRLA